MRHRFVDDGRWGTVALAWGASAACFSVFAIGWMAGGWVGAILGPIGLWWGGTLLMAALVLTLGDLRSWPRRRFGRGFVFTTALIVGLWTSSGAALPAALLVFPLYCLTERLVLPSLIKADTSGVYVPLGIWLACVVSGEMTGYLLGCWLFGVAPFLR